MTFCRLSCCGSAKLLSSNVTAVKEFVQKITKVSFKSDTIKTNNLLMVNLCFTNHKFLIILFTNNIKLVTIIVNLVLRLFKSHC